MNSKSAYILLAAGLLGFASGCARRPVVVTAPAPTVINQTPVSTPAPAPAVQSTTTTTSSTDTPVGTSSSTNSSTTTTTTR